MSEVLDQLAAQNGEVGEEAPQKEEVTQEGAPQEGQPEEVQTEAKYKIGDQEFATEREAFAHAERIQHEAALTEAKSDAYRQAILDAPQGAVLDPNVTQEAAPPEEDFEADFYANPNEAIKKRDDRIREEVTNSLRQELGQEREEEKVWNEFFQSHPDLADFKEDCEYAANKFAPDIKMMVKSKGKAAAMDFLAQKTRAKFQSWEDSRKPKRELQQTTSGPSTGTHQNVTRTEKNDAPLDMTEQMRQNRSQRGL